MTVAMRRIWNFGQWVLTVVLILALMLLVTSIRSRGEGPGLKQIPEDVERGAIQAIFPDLESGLIKFVSTRTLDGLPRAGAIPEQFDIQYSEDRAKVWWPWKGDHKCAKFAVRLGRNLPSILLLSYPRSGSIWLRFLLEGATGVFTGSTYMDPRLPKLGFLGESENPSSGATLLIRENFFPRQTLGADSPVVLIIRDPRDSLASYHSYLVGFSSFTYKGSEDDFKRPGFNVEGMLKQWENVAINRLKESRYLHVILFEDLKANPLKEIRQLLRFLRVPEDPERLACLANHLEGPVNRGQPKFDIYNKEQEALVAETVHRVSALLVQRGYKPLPYTNN